MTKNWCLLTVLLEKTPESPLDSKEIKSITLKGNQLWILIGRTDTEAKTPLEFLVVCCKQLTHWKSPWCCRKLREKEKTVSEDDMARWHHRCNGHEPGQTLGDGEEQRGLECCSPWGCKELDTTGQLNNNNWRKPWYGRTNTSQYSLKPYTKQPRHGINLNVHQQRNG